MSQTKSQDLGFTYSVKRTARRRTAAIQIDAGQVQVRVPLFTDDQWIADWVASKAHWIRPRLHRQVRAWNDHRIDLSEGALPINGQPVKLCSTRLPGRRSVQLDVAQGLIYVDIGVDGQSPTGEVLEARIKREVKEYAQRHLSELTEQLAQQLKLHPQSIRVRSYRRKWGQCSSRGEVSLNWRCIHLGEELQRYVIVHELCHLKELNHGPNFWSLVAQFCPNHLRLRNDLRHYGPYLDW